MRFRSCLSIVFLTSLLSATLTGCGGARDAIGDFGPRVYVDPSASVVGLSQSKNLSVYMLEGGTPDDYSWTVREGSAGGSLVVTLDGSTGWHSRAVYTAPSEPGTYHVDVTTHIFGVTEKGTSTITVQ